METLLVTCSTFPRWKNDTIPSFVYELSRRLTDNYNIVILTPHAKGSKTFEKWNGMKIYRYRYFFNHFETLADDAILPKLKKNPLLYIQLICLIIAQFFATKKIIKKEKVDKIQAHWILPQGFIASIIHRYYDIPYHIVSHGGDIFGAKGMLFLHFKKIALKNCRRASAVSNAIKKEIQRICPTCTTDVIPMGIDTVKFTPGKSNEDIKNNLDIKGDMLLFVGRLSEKKGLEYLIKAMPTVLVKFPKSKLIVIGSGEEETKLKSLVDALNLSKNIILLGAVTNKNLAKYYSAADIFIGPSIQTKSGDMEGFGLVFAEAMASGTLAIATDLPAIKDIIQDGTTGIIVKQKSITDLSNKIINILKNKKESKKISDNGLKFIRNNFDWKIIAKRYMVHLH